MQVEWIAAHALPLWAGWLCVALLIGDLAWQWNHHLYHAARVHSREQVVLRTPVAVLLLITALLLFGAIALAISGKALDGLIDFDVALARALHDHLPATLLRVLAVFTQLGNILVLAGAAAVVLVLLLLRRYGLLAVSWAITIAGVAPINAVIKAWFARPRPLGGHGFVTEAGWSFPSGHAFGSLVFYGMLAYVLLRQLPLRWHRAVIAMAIVMVTLIGGSRILLQAHYFSDVIGGYAIGAAWLVTCIGATEYCRLRMRPGVRPSRGLR